VRFRLRVPEKSQPPSHPPSLSLFFLTLFTLALIITPLSSPFSF
jgi:hypothetical protein